MDVDTRPSLSTYQLQHAYTLLDTFNDCFEPHIVYHTSFNASKPESSLLASSFLYTLSKYEKSIRRISTPQERRQRAHELAIAFTRYLLTHPMTLHWQKKKTRERRREEEREKKEREMDEKKRRKRESRTNEWIWRHSVFADWELNHTRTRDEDIELKDTQTNNHTGSTGQPNTSASTSNHKIATQFSYS
jgi:hypothetical protein